MARRRSGSSIPTISIVAAEAGVSTSTVSRAFSHPEMLTPATVERVHEVAARLGYVANHSARALSTGRAGTVAIVVPDIANPFFPPLIRGAQGQADRSGYSVLLGDSDEDPAKEDVLLSKLAAQSEGFVLASPRMAQDRILTHARRRPLVLVNRDVPGIPRVLIDTATGMASALEHLAHLGHQNVVYISGPKSSWSNQQRSRAVRAAARRLGVSVKAIPARRPTYAAGMSAVSEVLRTGATAALAFDDVVAQGLLAGLADRGITVPDQFSVIGCDDILAATTYPPLTTVTARCAEAGRVAVELLLERVAGQDAPDDDLRVVLDSSLVVRATTATASVGLRTADR